MWKEWRASELERDIEYCHPRWPQEAQYVNAEIKAVRNLSLMSGSDYWIYFDWVSLVFILATIVSHVIFFHLSTDLSKEVHHYITMPLLLILWLRIFKYARPFESAGPFIVIFSGVLGDIAKWAFLNLVIVIPFTCAFWMTFGAISLTPVDGYDDVGPLLYNIFSMMVVSNYGFENLEKANPFMARLLCGGFIAIAAIVTLNLLIALLTNTFERLYENAIANAVMQRAQTILLLEKSLRRKQMSEYYNFIKEKASPEVISRNLGRLLTTDKDEATIERVRDDVKVIMDILGEQFKKKFQKGKKSDLDFVRMDISKLRRIQEEMVVDVRSMKLSFEEVQVQLKQISSVTLMDGTKGKNQNEQNNNQNDSNNNESNHDESNSLKENDDDGNQKENIQNNPGKKINVNDVKNPEENCSKHQKHENKTNSKKGIGEKNKTKRTNLVQNSKGALGRKFGELYAKNQKKSDMGSTQKKLLKKVESSTETETSNTDSDSPSEDIANEKLKLSSGEKRDKRSRKKSEKNIYRNKPKVRSKSNFQNELPNFKRNSQLPFEDDGGVTRRNMANPPGNVQVPLHNIPDPVDHQQIFTYPPDYSLLDDPMSKDQGFAFQRSHHPPGQSKTLLPGMWKYEDIPYSTIPQKSLPNSHDRNQLVYDHRAKDPLANLFEQKPLPQV